MTTTNAILLVNTGIAFCLLVLVGTLLLWSNRRRERRPTGQRNDRRSRLRPTQNIDLSLTSAEGLALAEKAVMAAGGSKVVVDSTQSTVLGWTGMTRRSWGQALAVTVEDAPPNGCRLVCSRWPKYPPTIVDWGAGKLALQKLLDQIEVLDRQN